jgi:uncharacterized membrane protein (DUF485 family)
MMDGMLIAVNVTLAAFVLMGVFLFLAVAENDE